MGNIGSNKLIRAMLFMFSAGSIVVAPISSFVQPFVADDFTQGDVKSGISDLKEMHFNPVENSEYFAGIDQKGSITVDYMEYGTTGSHDLFIITTDTDDQSSLIIPTGINEDETIDDAPVDGELVQKSVRFFNGKFKGSPATFLFVSTLNAHSSHSVGVQANISVQLLQANQESPPPFEFIEISDFETTERFFNANDALKSELNIPLPGR